MALERSYSLYLDLTRFIAALLVVLTHISQSASPNDPIKNYLPLLGREAVIIFFVLSGYIIAYVTDNKTPSLQQFTVARAARIYSVALPVLLIVFVLGALFQQHPLAEAYQFDNFLFTFPFICCF